MRRLSIFSTNRSPCPLGFGPSKGTRLRPGPANKSPISSQQPDAPDSSAMGSWVQIFLAPLSQLLAPVFQFRPSQSTMCNRSRAASMVITKQEANDAITKKAGTMIVVCEGSPVKGGKMMSSASQAAPVSIANQTSAFIRCFISAHPVVNVEVRRFAVHRLPQRSKAAEATHRIVAEGVAGDKIHNHSPSISG